MKYRVSFLIVNVGIWHCSDPAVGMDTVIQNSVLDVQISMEKSLETVLKARGKPAGRSFVVEN
jgi:hypothetical protein